MKKKIIYLLLIVVLTTSFMYGCNPTNAKRAVEISKGIYQSNMLFSISSLSVQSNRQLMSSEINDSNFDKAFSELLSNDGITEESELSEEWKQMQAMCKVGAKLLLNANDENIDFLNENFTSEFDENTICYYSFDFKDDYVILDLFVDYDDGSKQFVRIQYTYIDDEDFTVKVFSSFGDTIDNFYIDVYYVYDKCDYYVAIEDSEEHFYINMLDDNEHKNYLWNSSVRPIGTSLNNFIDDMESEYKVEEKLDLIEELQKNPKEMDVSFISILIEVWTEQGLWEG